MLKDPITYCIGTAGFILGFLVFAAATPSTPKITVYVDSPNRKHRDNSIIENV